MRSRKPQYVLIISLLIALSLACALTREASDSSPEIGAENAIATSVAATLEAQQAEVPASEETPTNEPPPEPDILYQGVSFAYENNLADSVSAVTDPGIVDEVNSMWSIPEHILFSFEGYPLDADFILPQIKIYSVADYLAVNPGISAKLDALQAAIETQPADHNGVVVVDFFNAAQFFRSKVNYVVFQNGRGVRFLTQYGQAYYPIGPPYLVYAFQGFTDDRAYFISALFPVNHPSLPNPDDVALDEEFAANFETDVDELEIQLEGEGDETFQPSLAALDEVIESLRVMGE